jgi:hypothetical protein
MCWYWLDGVCRKSHLAIRNPEVSCYAFYGETYSLQIFDKGNTKLALLEVNQAQSYFQRMVLFWGSA